MFNENTYEEDVALFEKVLSTEADQLLCNESLTIVYIGRSTCPYCRKFAKKLSNLSNDIDSTIYYVESDNTSDLEIQTFRDKYNILTVPGFIVAKQGEITVRCDSSTPEKELLDMIN